MLWNYIITSTPCLLSKGLVGGRTMDYGPFGTLVGHPKNNHPWDILGTTTPGSEIIPNPTYTK